MADDWKVGDKAVCIDASTLPSTIDADVGRLRRGAIYTVTGLFCGGWGLYLAEEPPANPSGWLSDRFRKIRPDEHEDCEPEFVELLNRIKRKVSA